MQGIQGPIGLKGDNGDTIIDQNSNNVLKIWTGTKLEYDLILAKDPTTIYMVKK